ncbi:hypothetical protein VTO73DRAFT_5261 [Trametes versicolor]
MQLAIHEDRVATGEDINIVPIWEEMDCSNDALAVCTGCNEVIKLAIRILSVVANSSHLAADNVHDIGTVRLSIHREHAAAGLATCCLKWKLGADYKPSQENPDPEPQDPDLWR